MINQIDILPSVGIQILHITANLAEKVLTPIWFCAHFNKIRGTAAGRCEAEKVNKHK